MEILGRLKKDEDGRIIELLNARYEADSLYRMSSPNARQNDWEVKVYSLFGPTAIAKVANNQVPHTLQLCTFMNQWRTCTAAEAHPLVVGASLGTKGRRHQFERAFAQVIQRCASDRHGTACWSAMSDPCLQAADYCSWALQRKWERQDLRSYRLIESRIASEVDEWQGVAAPTKGRAGYPE